MKKSIAGTLLFVLLIAAFINNEGKRYSGYDPDSPYEYIANFDELYSVSSHRISSSFLDFSPHDCCVNHDYYVYRIDSRVYTQRII